MTRGHVSCLHMLVLGGADADAGIAHTLEHLIFMVNVGIMRRDTKLSNTRLQGSKSFTYKGVLDRLATRAYAYTNAWTAVDHTGYVLDTAGWEGFAQIVRSLVPSPPVDDC